MESSHESDQDEIFQVCGDIKGLSMSQIKDLNDVKVQKEYNLMNNKPTSEKTKRRITIRQKDTDISCLPEICDDKSKLSHYHHDVKHFNHLKEESGLGSEYD